MSIIKLLIIHFKKEIKILKYYMYEYYERSFNYDFNKNK